MIAPGLDEITRERAREAAREELSRKEYDDAQPALVFRVLGWLLRELGELLGEASARVPGGRTGVLLLAALAALGIGTALVRLGRPARRRAAGSLFDGNQVRTAADHRLLAEQAARDGRFADAVRERLRAVVRELEAGGVLDPRPGRTAAEVAREGGEAVPRLAEPLARAARVFEEIWYGGRSADASSYAVVVSVDQAVAGVRGSAS